MNHRAWNFCQLLNLFRTRFNMILELRKKGQRKEVFKLKTLNIFN
jgi:hypothetical protein